MFFPFFVLSFSVIRWLLPQETPPEIPPCPLLTRKWRKHINLLLSLPPMLQNGQNKKQYRLSSPQTTPNLHSKHPQTHNLTYPLYWQLSPPRSTLRTYSSQCHRIIWSIQDQTLRTCRHTCNRQMA